MSHHNMQNFIKKRPTTLLKRDYNPGGFPVNIVKYLRTPIFKDNGCFHLTT